MIGAKITGLPKLKANLRRSAQIPRGAALDADIKAALEPMRLAINARAPRRTLKGTARSAQLRADSPTRRTWWIAFIEPGRRIAHLIELGTAPHSLAKGASRRKGILQDVPPHSPGTPPIPFIRPTFEEMKAATARAFGQAIYRRFLETFGGRQ